MKREARKRGIARLSLSEFFGPSLGTVQDTKNPDRIGAHRIGGDIGRASDDQLAGVGNAARTTAFWEVYQVTRRRDPFAGGNRRVWVVSLNMGEDAVAIGERKRRPRRASRFSVGLVAGRRDT